MADEKNNLKLYYNETDITKKIDIQECVMKDVSGGENDCLNLLVDNAAQWLKWGVQKNDRIRVTRSGYDTRTLYVNTIAPEDGSMRIYATGSKCALFEQKRISYENTTLAGIMAGCAGEGGMGFKLFGLNEQIFYEYMLRDRKKATEFLNTLMEREGAVLKSMNGCFTGIGISYAQDILCRHRIKIGGGMEINGGIETAEYIDKRDQAWSSVTIETPFGTGQAIDTSGKGQAKTMTDLTVDNDGQAKRWARGLLLSHNRKNETLSFETDFDPGLTAMVRVDVDSTTAAAGEWLVDSVEQDMKQGRTKAKLYRCIRGIV